MVFRDLYTAASALTLLRGALAVAAPWWAGHPWAVAVYLVAMLTDVLDGEVARRTGTCTRSGAALDGWVDKILHVNLGWSLAVADRIPDAWMLAWCAREILQAPMVFILIHRFRTASAPPPETSAWGRVTAVALSVAVVAALLGVQTWVPTAVAGAAGVVSGIQYGSRYLPRRPTADSPAPFFLEGLPDRT